jgi:RecA-family ATPase
MAVNSESYNDKTDEYAAALIETYAKIDAAAKAATGNVLQGPWQAQLKSSTSTIATRRINVADLAGKDIPEREWLVPGWIPAKQVTLVYGDGGTGKSLAILQLAAAVVPGGNDTWFGIPITQKGPVEFISAEDERDELHRRLIPVSRSVSKQLDAYDGLHITSLADEDAMLAGLIDGKGALVETALFHELESVLAKSRPALLVLDTLADVFGGNEIVRQQARSFVNMLRRLAITYDTTVVVLAHPSITGINSGTGTSGSTGWNNSVRSRLYLNRVYGEDKKEVDPDLRTLSLMKSNYSQKGTEITLRYRAGMFVPQSTGADPVMASYKVDRLFLELLAKYIGQNRYVSVSEGKSYAPAVFASEGAKQGVSKAALKESMHRLIDSGQIENAPHGAPSKKQYRLFPTAANGGNGRVPTPANACQRGANGG